MGWGFCENFIYGFVMVHIFSHSQTKFKLTHAAMWPAVILCRNAKWQMMASLFANVQSLDVLKIIDRCVELMARLTPISVWWTSLRVKQTRLSLWTMKESARELRGVSTCWALEQCNLFLNEDIPNSVKVALGIWAIAHWEAIVWQSLKQSIALCSLCPSAPIANDQLPKQSLLN